MMGRMSLVEQKRLQWAKEREEMARLNGQWEVLKTPSSVHSTIRTKMSSREQNTNRKPLRACGQQYGSAASLKSLDTNVSTSVQSLNLNLANSGSMININNHRELPELMRKRSPSLPPISTKEHQHHYHQTHSSQELPSLEVEGSHYTNHPRVQKHFHRDTEQRTLTCNTYEEREGETSGYASDSMEVPAASSDIKKSIPLEKGHGIEMTERTWQNPYCDTPDTSLPSSRRFSSTRLGELNRPRWGSIWGPENANSDPPPPSWLERGLSRLDHSSQVLVITHDSVSSPDSSTSSTNSDSKTYLRGQNIPVDAQILHERETRRQKALELQSAIKQQLEERDRKRKEEKEQKLKEEREEEERIKRERDREKARFEEEQQRLKEKEQAKLKKEEAMRESLETAERIAKEKKRQRRHRDDYNDVNIVEKPEIHNQPVTNDNCPTKIIESINDNDNTYQNAQMKTDNKTIGSEQMYEVNINKDNETNLSTNNDDNNEKELHESLRMRDNEMRLPVNKEVAIVLTGKIEDSDFLNGNNLQLLNFVVNNPTPKCENNSNVINPDSINALLRNLGNLGLDKNMGASSCSPTIIENRLLTPSKYRTTSGRDFGTQTDGENDIHNMSSKEMVKERKEHNDERDIEKSTNTLSEEKIMGRSKSQPRQKLETRPRWNANRPGTRYRTQSEKDPHYQKRMRLRRRRVESSDERSRSPSPDRRMSNAVKAKIRNALHRKSKLDSYDADLSMESLNSVVPLRIDEHGRINIGINADSINNGQSNENSSNSNDESTRMMESRQNSNAWDGQNVISQLVSLKNGLLSKQREWDSSRCLVSPTTEFY